MSKTDNFLILAMLLFFIIGATTELEMIRKNTKSILEMEHSNNELLININQSIVMKTYNYRNQGKNYTVILRMRKYPNGRNAIELLSAKDHEPIAIATINLVNEAIGEHEVIVKDYAENEGMYRFLRENNIISPSKRIVYSGHIAAPVVDLLVNE